MQTFTLTAEHVALLRRGNIRQGDDWQAPAFDQKRPFGNSDIVGDIATLVGIEPVELDYGETGWPPGTSDRALALLGELHTALQVVLATGSFAPGDYEADDYGSDWRAARSDPQKPTGA